MKAVAFILLLAGWLFASEAVDKIAGDDRENLHLAQKRVLLAQKQVMDAQASLQEAARQYEALQEVAREKAKRPKGCILDERLDWQCPDPKK